MFFLHCPKSQYTRLEKPEAIRTPKKYARLGKPDAIQLRPYALWGNRPQYTRHGKSFAICTPRETYSVLSSCLLKQSISHFNILLSIYSDI